MTLTAIRALVLGRRNYMFAGSDAGGETAARLFSLIGTCRLNGLDPHRYHDPSGLALYRVRRLGRALATMGRQMTGMVRTPEAVEYQVFRHPLHDVDSGSGKYSYRRLSPLYLADYVSDSDGTGIVHSAPAYGVDDFNSCVAHGLAYDDILNPVQGNGV